MNAIDVLVAQHRVIERLFGELEQQTDRRRVSSAVSQLAEELIAHLAAEETVFYPALRQVLDDGSDTDDCSRSDRLAMRIELRRMLEASVADDSFGERIARMRRLFQQHARREEDELFPRFVEVAPESQNRTLGSEIAAARPSVWIVTPEPGAVQTGEPWRLPSRVSLPIPARG